MLTYFTECPKLTVSAGLGKRTWYCCYSGMERRVERVWWSVCVWGGGGGGGGMGGGAYHNISTANVIMVREWYFNYFNYITLW